MAKKVKRTWEDVTDEELKENVDRAILILKEFCPPEGYYLAFSGGKDSVCIKELANMAGVKYDAHYCVTTVDPPELMRFIRDEHKDVEWVKPPAGESLYKSVPKHGVPTRTVRWCCRIYKEHGGAGRITVVGVRHAESHNRSKYQIVAPCQKAWAKGKIFVSPIVHWSEEVVWAFIRKNNLPYCSLYDEGWKRLGCVVCPMLTKGQTQKNIARWPEKFEKMKDAITLSFEKSPALQSRFNSGEEVYEWWISRDQPYPKPREIVEADEPEEAAYYTDQFAEEDVL